MNDSSSDSDIPDPSELLSVFEEHLDKSLELVRHLKEALQKIVLFLVQAEQLLRTDQEANAIFPLQDALRTARQVLQDRPS